MSTEEQGNDPIERWLGRALPFAPVAVAVFWLARTTSRAILAKASEPAVPLDDAWIHFQYARSLAEGRFFAFQPGDPYTSGATSLLWPAMLAPFYALGLRGTSIVWAAWLWAWIFLALLAIEVKKLAEPLVGKSTAVGAAIATLAFGGYTWFAASGMEVTPLAWALCVTARLAATWGEEPEKRDAKTRNRLVALGILGPLLRPEGMVCSGLALLTLAAFPATKRSRKEEWIARSWGLAAMIGPLVPPLINKVLTGHFATTTTQVKWLALNPYYGGAHLWVSVRANIDLFVERILDGRDWSAIFIPAGALPVAAASFGAIPYAGFRSGRWWRAALVLLLAIGMAIPTTYLSFLWNRLRYLWPFAFAWCIGIACLARALADVAAIVKPRFALAAPVLVGIGAGLLGHHLSWTIDDVSQSAYAITAQQVHLGRWAKDHLPKDARIGVNDTGAIAYFSERRIFDVVGLTTPEEARYWVAGPGSRFEHYERLQATRPEVLPTHFIVYPHWMACDPVLGRELTRATVTDQSILGGTTMVAYEARWDLLHSGDRPMEPPAGALVDELDVSDLESEEAHGLDVLGGGGVDTDNTVRKTETDLGKAIVDAGRDKRTKDAFRISGKGGPATLVARLASTSGTRVSVKVNGAVVDGFEIPPSTWFETTVRLPDVGPATPIEIVAPEGRTFGSLHYWLYQLRAKERAMETPAEDLLRKRPLGKTGLDVSELALGTWGLSGEAYGLVNETDADATIERAVELGIGLFDTSDAYGKGSMEARLGRILEPHREKTKIVTRVGVDRSETPPRKRFDVAFLEQAVAKSKERLRREKIDVLLLHNPTVDVLVRGQTVAFLNELKTRGAIGAWGVSAGDTEVARVSLQVGAEVVSFPYNLTIGSDLHSLVGDLAREKAGLLVHSVLAYGLLAGTWHEAKTFGEGDHRRDRWTRRELAARIEQLDAVRSLVGGDVLTMRAAAVRYVLANQIVSSAILGPRNVAQLEQLVREAGKGPPYLDEQKLAKLPARLQQVGIDP